MVLVDWEDLPVATRRSPRKLYNVIKEAVNGSGNDGFLVTVNVTNGLEAVEGAIVAIYDDGYDNPVEETTSSEGSCSFAGIAEGEHNIRIIHGDYPELSDKIYIDEDNNAFTFDLNRVQPIDIPVVC